MSKFEIFCDHYFYEMHCVKPVDDKDFNSPLSFHFAEKKDAEAFHALIEKAVTVNIRKICCETCGHGEPAIQDRIECSRHEEILSKNFHCSWYEVKI